MTDTDALVERIARDTDINIATVSDLLASLTPADLAMLAKEHGLAVVQVGSLDILCQVHMENIESNLWAARMLRPLDCMPTELYVGAWEDVRNAMLAAGRAKEGE